MTQALAAVVAAISIASATLARGAQVRSTSHRVASGANAARRCPGPPPEPAHPINRATWLSGVTITEYYPAPERWFTGERVAAPGLPGRHAVDWLYSARGVSMEGDGIDRSGRHVHIDHLGSSGWVNSAGHPTNPVCLGQWTNGRPDWRGGGWRNAAGEVTFPLASGGWSNGGARRALPYGGVTFAPGSSLPLRYYRNVAVDPKLIPEGSRIYIPAYRPINGGWFVAADTGGAIKSRHIDVLRPPPASPSDQGRYYTGQRVYVIPPR
jgi:3D (Asp-Asp-Asp) domain-containing protein